MSTENVTTDERTMDGRPWVKVHGINNFRSLGGYKVGNDESETRPGWIYRCAEPSKITDEGKEVLKRRGVKKIFDLRSETELEKMQKLTPLTTIDGVTRVFVPVFRKEDYGPEEIAKRYKTYTSGGVEGFTAAYKDILISGADSYRIVFLHLRDHPEEPCILHCTAGKDRTGVLCALILSLAGVDDDTVAEEYELTTIGLAPMRPLILQHLQDEPSLRGDKQGAENMLSSRKDAMMATLVMIREQYGSVEGYLQKMCKFSDQDIATIKKNLVVDIDPNIKDEEK